MNESVGIDTLDTALLVGALVLIVAVAAVRLSARVGLPTLLLYVALGMALGPDGLAHLLGAEGLVIDFHDPGLTRLLGYAALVIILAEGGLTTSWPRIRDAVPGAAALATVGVAVSVVVTGGAAYLLLDIDWQLALLLGAVVSSTDAAAVFSVLRRVPLPPRVAGLLEAESGFNDAPVVIIVVALSAADHPATWALPGIIALELAGGALVGLAVGRLGAVMLRRIALPASGLYPIAVLALALGAYGLAATVHASGFLAVYLAALVLGNSHLPHGPATRGFAEGLAWLAQIGLFVLLGLIVYPDELPAAMLPAIGIGLALLLVARPLSVAASLTPFGIPWREQAFVSWAGLRGAVPIVLATIPVVEGVDGDRQLFNVVFVLVVVFTLVQAPTLPFAARRLGLRPATATRDLDVESSPLDHLGAALLQLTIPPGSRLHGAEIFELRLPDQAAITLVVRDGHSFVPGPRTVLQRGDELLIVSTAGARARAESRLQAVSRGGRLAGWRRSPTR